MNMQDESIGPLNAESVEKFDVWIFDSQDLVVSIVPHQAPWGAMIEEYRLTEQ
jgi:hypothetical protein